MTAALHLAQDFDAAEPAQAVDPVKFAPLLEVAETLGMDRGHVARLCRDKWKPAGLAFQAVPPEGGSPTWYVSRRADLRLVAILGDEYQPRICRRSRSASSAKRTRRPSAWRHTARCANPQPSPKPSGWRRW